MKHVSNLYLIKHSKNSNSFYTNEILFIAIGIPAVYALLPDRKATTYIYLFNVLFAEAKKFDKKFDPVLIVTDFEPGVAKAISLEV